MTVNLLIVICISIYVCIGMLIGFLSIKTLEMLSDDYEQGEELEKYEIEILEEASKIYNIFGVKHTTLILMLSTTLLWPVAIYKSITDK